MFFFLFQDANCVLDFLDLGFKLLSLFLRFKIRDFCSGRGCWGSVFFRRGELISILDSKIREKGLHRFIRLFDHTFRDQKFYFSVLRFCFLSLLHIENLVRAISDLSIIVFSTTIFNWFWRTLKINCNRVRKSCFWEKPVHISLLYTVEVIMNIPFWLYQT